MSSKVPIRTVFDDGGNATGLAEYQTGEFIPLTHGGIGAFFGYRFSRTSIKSK